MFGPPPPLHERVFKKYDADKSGELCKKEFSEVCYDLGHFYEPVELDLAFSKIDANGSGHICLAEFTRWWKTADRFEALHLSDSEKETLARASHQFKSHDGDLSGSLNKAEASALYSELAALGLVGGKSLDNFLVDLDPNNDGRISFNEYVDWLIRTGAQKVKVIFE